jgi:hypothetical protein
MQMLLTQLLAQRNFKQAPLSATGLWVVLRMPPAGRLALMLSLKLMLALVRGLAIRFLEVD